MTDAPSKGPGRPTAPIEFAGDPAATTAHLSAPPVAVGDDVAQRVAAACKTTSIDPADLAETSRDWWPLAMCWALDNQVGALAAMVARPTTVDEVRSVVSICNEARVPLTTVAGRSGVSGGSVPLHGGVALDMCGITGISEVDETSMVVDVAAGTFGDHFEADLRARGFTAGHWPQSMALATVGGWIACRGAGQLSTRYGKIEDIVTGLDVVLADGTLISTGDQPRQAAGPDLTQLFVGSEGTLGVIVGARLRLHPAPPFERRGVWSFSSFAEGLAGCRRILQRGATPAVLRLYDEVESDRNYDVGTDGCVLIVLDEGDEHIVGGTWAVVEEECAEADVLDDSHVGKWLDKRNDVTALEALIGGGLVVDTMEVSAPWSRLDAIYQKAITAISETDGTLAVSAHQSHAYTDGACLYFTFAAKTDQTTEAKDAYYREVWDAGTRAVLDGGGSLSHHHGVGLNRSRFMGDALGGSMAIFQSVKSALDPHGILNPGKLGLSDPFGSAGAF